MANFQPLKDRFVRVLEENLKVFEIGGRFIDFGCGRGDVAEHLIRNPLFTEGHGYDLAVTEEQICSGGPREGGGHLTYARTLSELPSAADLAVLLDVIEHVPDPGHMLREIGGHVRTDGWLIVTVPYNPHEWGVDDEFYGHLRRLSLRGMVSLLENNGWNVIRLLDPTFPSFWFIRRGYLLSKRLAGEQAQGPSKGPTDDIARTLKSSRQSAWDYGGLIPRLLGSSLAPWSLVRKFDLYFESVFRGFELFAVCQKRSGSRDCGVCLNGHFTYKRFFQRHSLQQCMYCSTEKILPRRRDDVPPRDLRRMRMPLLGRALAALRGGRLRRLARLPVPAKTMAVISRTEQHGKVPDDPSWKVNAWHGEALFDERREIRLKATGARYGIAALLHVMELFEEPAEALRLLDELVAPGGYAYLEFPSSRSWLKRLLKWRWFGYDPPFHRYVMDPLMLADQMGMRNYRLVEESHFSLDYSFFIFAQSLINTLLPFQRDALFHWLSGRAMSGGQVLLAMLSIPLLLILLPLFLIFQPLVSLARRGCIVRQLYRKTDMDVSDPSRNMSHD